MALSATEDTPQANAAFHYRGLEPRAWRTHHNKAAADALYYVHTNHLGAPVAVTDSMQTPVWHATYTPFSLATVHNNTITLNIRLPGQYEDSETGLYYNHHRYYDPQLGRYLTSDPLGLVDGVNTYAYAINNPVNNIDPKGLSVYVCKRPVDTSWLPKFISSNVYHKWIKTDSLEAGMGGECPVPGQQCADRPYSQTKTKSHEGQADADNASCELMQNVNEHCVNALIWPGQPTGTWSLINQCQSFSYSVINQCRYGPQIGPILPEETYYNNESTNPYSRKINSF